METRYIMIRIRWIGLRQKLIRNHNNSTKSLERPKAMGFSTVKISEEMSGNLWLSHLPPDSRRGSGNGHEWM